MTYSEHARAETTNGCGCNLGDVDRSHDRSLSNTETTDEATSVDGTKVSVDTTDHEDDNTKSPKRAKNTSSPNTTNAITDQESAAQVSPKFPNISHKVEKTYIKAPPTEPICTIAETLALMLACSTSE